MPTYEYSCTACGEHLEIVQSFRDEALTTCPACGGPLRKVFGSIGIVFKGSGFYKTDSRSSGSGSRPARSDGSATTARESSDAGPASASGSSPASASSGAAAAS
jgi:putative FmdB family regulatory protein